MIYTDGIHLIAESIDELQQYANKAGIRQKIQWTGKNIHPHIDIVGKKKHKGWIYHRVMMDDTVQKVSSREIVRLCKLIYCFPTEDNIEEWEAYHKDELAEIKIPTEEEFQTMFDNILKRIAQ